MSNKTKILIIILSAIVMFGISVATFTPCSEWCSVCGRMYCNEKYGANNWELIEYRCGLFWLRTSLTCIPKEGVK